MLPSTFYSEQEKEEFELLTNQRRRQERAATLWLLHDFLCIKSALHHNNNGCPYLADSNLNISISHTQQEIAIALHPSQKVGIDIENTQRDFARVASRFLSEKEGEFCATQRLQCLAWCAKEAIFKVADEQGIDFATQINLEPFGESNEGEISAHFLGKTHHRDYLLRYHLMGNTALTYCTA